jgi:hypothetical protein
MNLFSPEKLVIFDYSGTLSLEAPRFARPANLLSALAESGLARLGVATPEAFWGEIVGPTWTEGSTTEIGYKRIIAQRIEALGFAPGVAGAEIAAAASHFVDLYLVHSRIDLLWRPLLESLAGNHGACVIIATDHYAEATQTIIDNLHSWNIPAQKADQRSESFAHAGDGSGTPLGPGRGNGGAKSVSRQGSRELPPFFIANSADIGFWKADRRFWEAVRLQLAITAVRSVLIIDDFGFNEEQGDSYGERARVEAREKETAASLQEIFQTSLTVIPFFLKSSDRDRKEARAQRIAETVHRTDRVLNPRDVTR